MQPTPGDVHVNAPLTSICIAYAQNATNFISSRVFPRVPVNKQSDRYYVYDRGSFNRDEMKIRAPATESEGSGYTVDNTPNYFCNVWALHKDVDDQLRANADTVIAPDRDATIFLTQKGLIRREKLFTASYFGAGLWSFERAGVAAAPAAGVSVLHWSDPGSTPVEDVRAAKTIVLQSTGFEPNKLTLGRKVYDVLVDHSDIIDRLKGGQTPSGPAQATRNDLAKLFEVDEVLVMNAIENTAAEGQTAAHAFIGGNHALLTYSPPSPGLMVPSAGYWFDWSGLMGSQASGWRIKQFRMEQLEADRVEIQMATTAKMIAADLGFFFNAVIA
jgi:Phage major capsid protein E